MTWPRETLGPDYSSRSGKGDTGLFAAKFQLDRSTWTFRISLMKSDNDGRSLSLEAAKRIVRLKVDAKTQARINRLARKCNQGNLTSAEKAEYEAYVAVGNKLAILKAKARLIIAKKS